jgi:hypothetical protein
MKGQGLSEEDAENRAKWKLRTRNPWGGGGSQRRSIFSKSKKSAIKMFILNFVKVKELA